VRTIKLSQYAKEQGVKYATVWKWHKKGLITGVRKLPTGKLVIDVPDATGVAKKNLNEVRVALYARTSSSQNKKLLEDQMHRLESFAAARGYKIVRSVKEHGSGLNDTRSGLSSILLHVDEFDKIIVEHKDRLTRFGFNWFQLFTKNKIEVINESKTEESEITDDLIAIIHCFAAKMYGPRRKKRKMIEVITND
jgi:predicted site-specific integrase-resolvase